MFVVEVSLKIFFVAKDTLQEIFTYPPTSLEFYRMMKQN